MNLSVVRGTIPVLCLTSANSAFIAIPVDDHQIRSSEVLCIEIDCEIFALYCEIDFLCVFN